MVFPPILESFLVSDNDATPQTKLVRTNGTAINFNKLIKTIPNGEIQSDVKLLNP